MAEEKGTLHAVTEHLVLALQPLTAATSDLDSFKRLMLRLGWSVNSLPAPYQAAAGKVGTAVQAVQALGQEPTLDEVEAALAKLRAAHTALDGLKNAPAPSGVSAATFSQEIVPRLLELLVTDYLAVRLPAFCGFLRAVGVLELEEHQTPPRPAFVRSRLRFDRATQLLSDPGLLARQVYGWGTDQVGFELIADYLAELLYGLGSPAYIVRVPPDLGEALAESADVRRTGVEWMLAVPLLAEEVGNDVVEVGLALLELPAGETKPPGVILQPLVPSQVGTTVEISDNLDLQIRAGTTLGQQFGILVRPGEIAVRYPFQPGQQLPSAGFGFALEYSPPEPKLLLGEQPTGSRLEMAGAKASFDLDTHQGAIELRLGLAIEDLAGVIAVSEQDGFLGKVLAGTDTRVPIPLDLAWSNTRGLEFGGSPGFEVAVSPHLELGPIRLEEVELAIRAKAGPAPAPPQLRITVGVEIAGRLGPIAFAVDGVGVSLDMLFKQGNAGPIDVQVGFKPPTGVGLAVDAVVIKGGGFLSFKPDEGEYFGVLELSIKDTVQVKAIGLLNTRLPGGQQGFSLLLIITAQFPPIQLSFGFVLTGVGGLIGVNRTMVIEVLRAGIRNRTLDSIMFPENPVQNAPKIISDLKAVFPPAERRYVFGPMVEIGWGTPTLVFGRLGFLLELPEPIRLAILGQLKLALPKPEEAIVEINLDALGIIEFERSSLSIDASLYDSRVAVFELSGDMALRLLWAPQPNFALSVGGLNPRFKPPPGFPELRRLTLALGQSQNPRLTLEAYMALTSNSVQFGAHLELYAEGGGFVLHGYLGFDALFILSPFSFVTEMAAGIELSRGGAVLMSIHLEFTLEGPRPWHAFGKASFKILFITISVGFDVRFGEEAQVTLPPADAKAPLIAALADARNWSATLPPAAELGATRGPGAVPKGAVLVHPFGRLGVRQTVVPLNIEISRFGAAVPAGARHFSVSEARLNQQVVARETVKEYFARGPFFELSDEAKVAGESFELMDAGANLGAATGIKKGHQSSLDLEYETQLVENVAKPSVRLADTYEPSGDVFSALVHQGAAAVSAVQTSGDGKFVEPGSESKVKLFESGHVIASKSDLALREDLSPEGGTGRTAAEQALKDYLEDHPDEREELQVVPVQEAVPA